MINLRHGILGAAPLAALALLVAGSTMSCSSQSPSSVGSAGLAQTRTRPPSDDTIDLWVNDALRLDPRIPTGEITARTSDGVVKLNGIAGNPVEKKYARLEAEKVDGVRAVINEIDVAKSDRSDSEIQKDIERRLSNGALLHLQHLKVTMDSGEATLWGEAPSWSAFDYATMLAREVRGVHGVINRMEISSKPQSDDQNRDDIIAAINRDVYLSGLPIVVQVHDGTATLEGKVGNAYEKERATDLAWRESTVSGVENHLVVDWLEERGVREHQPVPDDDQIRQAVRAAIDQDLRLESPSKIQLRVANGVVTLEGTVPGYLQERLAKQDARDVIGVHEVISLLTKSEQLRSDSEVAADVRLELQTDWALNQVPIQVAVHDGEVRLSGTVDSTFKKDHATAVTSDVAGVIGVSNDIMVNPGTGYTDGALAQMVSERLDSNWETGSLGDRIHVRVEDGRAILEGSVDTTAQRREAARIAGTIRGLRSVDNRLKVSPEPAA